MPKVQVPEDCYSLKPLAKELDVTYRVIDYWSRVGYINAHNAGAGSGSIRWLEEREYQILKLMIRLTGAGFETETAALVARRMVFDQLLITTLPGGITITLTEDPDSGSNEAEDLQGDGEGQRDSQEV